MRSVDLEVEMYDENKRLEKDMYKIRTDIEYEFASIIGKRLFRTFKRYKRGIITKELYHEDLRTVMDFCEKLLGVAT